MGAAILEYRRALAEARDSIPIMNRLAGALLDLNRHEEALEILQRGKDLSPDHPTIYTYLGQAYLKLPMPSGDTLRKIAELTPTGAHIAKAPMAVAILMDCAKLPEIDGTRAIQNMVLAAWDLGIGACWVANFYEDGVKDLLGAPQRMKLLTVLPFGYSAEPKTSRKKNRKLLAEIVHYERFEGRRYTNA
jgi:tetratricopeptide (TPR) repeat protein